MKKIHFLTMVTVAMLMALASCKPIDDPKDITKGVTVTTADPTFITSTTATLGAEVAADDPGLLLELGVCWSQTGTPSVDDQSAQTYRCSQPYQCFITDLEPNTEYHVRGYAKYGTEYCYGDEKTFTTLNSNSPLASPVTTIEATGITAQSFHAGATIEPFGLTNFTVGICISTNPEFTLENCQEYFDAYYNDESGIYEAFINYLMPNTQYYYRAFVNYRYDNSYRQFYGEILSLTTPEAAFVLNLETYNPDLYGGNNWGRDIIANGGGYCTNLQMINQIGFCYSKDNEYPQYESDLFIIAATPTGSMHFEFSSYISNLSANTKYYIRSYARYMTDSLKYGNVVSFNTY